MVGLEEERVVLLRQLIGQLLWLAAVASVLPGETEVVLDALPEGVRLRALR